MKPVDCSGFSNLTLKKSSVTMFSERWFWSSNAKDIGTLYLIFALFAGLIGTAFSVLIRIELSAPGVQYISDNQLYNSIITAHAIVMIFFMVKKCINANMFFAKTRLSLPLNRLGGELSKFQTESDSASFGLCNASRPNEALQRENNNHDNNDNISVTGKNNYVKILIEDPYNNRKIISNVTKKQKGIYIWETIDGKNIYVGHSINMYNRICSYFMPSILKTKARRVLKYLNKHGFSNIKLTVYVMDIDSNRDQVVALEQQFIDRLNPNLNVDLVAASSGYHEPMSQEARDLLRKEKGIPVFMYDSETLTLLYVFGSKQQMYSLIGIHHKTLNDCLDSGNLYLNHFFLSLDLLETDASNDNLLDLDEIKVLVENKRAIHKLNHPAAKAIVAEYKDDLSKKLEFDSINSLAKHLKGDRQVIRDYLHKNKSGYYRGKWTFSYK